MSIQSISAPSELATAAHGPSSAAATHADPVLETVTSRDGTTIGYRRFGSGPTLLLLHGSMSSGAHHTDLARLLSDAFTVVVPDRRGRGLSGPYQAGDEMRQELEDVDALITATSAENVWGLSSGACIALHAARTLPGIRRVALFEPPLLPDRARAAAILGQFDAEMTRGRISNAMIVAMRGSEMGPGWFRALPTWLTARLVSTGMNRETKEPAGEYPTMRELAPTLHADFVVVTASSGPVDGLGTIPAEVLLMGGSRSPAFLKRALDDLARALPTARRIELEGMDHAASWNADRRGHPKPVARELRGFFA
jgi:pimeloyl-ACP methyl ester carboxylesterase